MGKKFINKLQFFKKWLLTEQAFTIGFSLVLVLSVLPRSIEVLNGNPVFGFDQGREYLMTQDIVDNKNLRLIGTPLGAGAAGLQGIFHGPVYYYLLGVPYILFNGNPAGGTVLMFVIGVLSLLASYFLGKDMFGKIGGLLTMALVGMSPLFISQSRFLWSPYPSTLFILLAFYFIFHIKKSSLNIFLAAFFSVFIYNFELAIAVPLAFTLLIYVIYLFRFRLIKYVYLFAGFIVGLLPMILFEVRHSFMAVNGMISYLTSSKSDEKFEFVPHFLDHLNAFGNHLVASFPYVYIFHIVLFIILFFPFFFLLTKEKNKNLKHFLIFLITLPVINFAILLFLRNAVYHYYLYHLTVIYIIVFVFILLRSGKFKLLRVGAILLLIAFAISFLITYTKSSLYDINDYGGTAKLKGKVDAIDYIFNDAKGERFGLFVFSPPVYTYPYDYIISWRQEKYGFTPTQSKEGVFYLLIEKDPEKPWSYEGWLQTVIKTGNVEKEVVLPSGFIIQKRIGE